jgi:hypothetical protein
MCAIFSGAPVAASAEACGGCVCGKSGSDPDFRYYNGL